MKKLVFILLPFMLVSCFKETNKIEDAKREALWDKKYEEIVNAEETSTGNDITSNYKEETLVVEKIDKPYIKLENLSREEIFTIPELPTITTATKEFSITWKILWEFEVDKVMVTFSNKTSEYPNDPYTLTTFKPWDSEFKYNANMTPFNVLDYGVNEYLISAYIWEKVFSQKLEIYIPSPYKEPESSNTEDFKEAEETTWSHKGYDINGNYFTVEFPEADSYGSVIEIEDWVFTYSKVEDFKINAVDKLSLSCDNSDELSDHLINEFWYVYWNSCVPLTSKNWLGVNVLQIKDGKYNYFKYYADTKNALYGIKDLDSGEWIDKTNIADKNKEFKNKDFSRFVILTDTIFNKVSE